jgi:xylan 1,4-beta-xylosidase
MWAVRGEKDVTVMLTNFALPRHPIATETVTLSLRIAQPESVVSLRRIDLEHANAKRHWEQMGKPDYLTASMIASLNDASRMNPEPLSFAYEAGMLNLEVVVPPQSVAAIHFTCPR